MKSLPAFLIAALLFSCGSPNEPDIAGHWTGNILGGPEAMPVVIHIEKDSSGDWASTMDSPSQGAEGIPVDEVKFEGDSVVLLVASISGKFTAKYHESNDVLDGRWEQGGYSFELNMKRVESVAGVNRPQEPKPPFPYEARDTTFKNSEAGHTLAGTLTIPEGDGPFPAAVLISGSGPQDRNEELVGHKPFLVIADYLTRNGYAVLRYDDRGFGESTGDFESATSFDFAEDVKAAVTFLRQQDEINSERIGLIGHSEGGLIAPLVAVDDKDIAYCVLLAGPGVTGQEIMYEQNDAIYRTMGANDSMIVFNREVQKRFFSIILSEDQQNAEEKLLEEADEVLEETPEHWKAQLGYSPEIFELQLPQLNTAWFRFFLKHDPRPVLERVVCPVLALLGGKDVQVPAEANRYDLEKSINGRTEFNVVKVFDDCNHLFQTAETGALQEYAKIEETFSEEVLQYMLGWIEGLR